MATAKKAGKKSKEPELEDLYFDVSCRYVPIVFSPEYDISFARLENLHSFDAKKWGKVYQFLKEKGVITDHNPAVVPREAKTAHLLRVHTKSYINSLKWSVTVATVIEIPIVAVVPNFLLQRSVLQSFRYQTGGTVLAGKLAVERGWAINLGGGFHHCSAERGEGFCVYADISMCIHWALDKLPSVHSVMIVDLDAHQGNGHERDFSGDKRVYIMDVYNKDIYPKDKDAKRGIDRRVELSSGCTDDIYLFDVGRNLEAALKEFDTNLLFYNAGTDILENDPLGHLSITEKGVIKRDEIVFSLAREYSVPIVMATSGGYRKRTAAIIANSIYNLWEKKIIF